MEETTEIGMDAVLAAAGRRLLRFWLYALMALAFGLIPALIVNALVRRFAPVIVQFWIQPPLYMEIWLLPDGLAVALVGLFTLLASAAVVHFALNDESSPSGARLAAAGVAALRRLPVLLISVAQLLLLFSLFFILMRWPKGYSLTFVVDLVGVIFICRYAAKFALFVPVCMAEEVGLFAGLRRSARLSRGYRGVVFLLLLASSFATLALASPPLLLLQEANRALKADPVSVHGAFLQTLYNQVSTPWFLLWAVLGAIVWNVANAMLYRRLRDIETSAARTPPPDAADR